MKRLFFTLCFLLIAGDCLAASSRVMPAAYNESTYGSGADYTSLATWEADTDIDVSTTGEVLTCSAGVYNDSVTLDGATTDADGFRVIRAASGARGTSTSGVRFEKSATLTDVFVIAADENNFHCFDIAAKAVTTASTSIKHAVGFLCAPGTGSYWVGCTAYDCANTGSVTYSLACGFYIGYYGEQSHYLINCVAKNISGSNINSAGVLSFCSTTGTVNIYIYNMTINDTNTPNAIYGATGGTLRTLNLIIKNTIIQDYSGSAIFTGGDGTENIYQTTNVTSGVTFAADGYHLDSTDTGAIGNGTDLSADAVFAFDDDIDGETRNDWDIGADEYVASSTRRRVIIVGD